MLAWVLNQADWIKGAKRRLSVRTSGEDRDNADACAAGTDACAHGYGVDELLGRTKAFLPIGGLKNMLVDVAFVQFDRQPRNRP